MKRVTIGRWAAHTAMMALVVLLASAMGCHRDCYRYFTCPSPTGASDDAGSGGTGGTGGSEGTGGSGGSSGTGGADGDDDCPVDPSDGEVRGECGFWVSATHGDDLNPGTQAMPVKTIGRAVELAKPKEAPKSIYVCGEEYSEAKPVALEKGISLFGGFTGCDGEGNWAYEEVSARATILGLPDAPALTILDGGETSFLREIEVRAADAKEPGGSSIAVFAKDLASADIRRSRLIVGNGADGEDGEIGGHNGLPAHDGLTGNPGADACSMNPGLGGEAVILMCEDGTISLGGAGGDGSNLAASQGQDGKQPPNMDPQGYGVGGKGETGTACAPGAGGAQGQKGENGNGGSSNGHITPEGRYIGAAGGDGQNGTPGQGGGGGGASLGKAAFCGAAPPGGGGGGSGGTGGCGGQGGKGGQAGGSSIGIAVRGNGVTMDSTVTIWLGNGGNGGRGGALQPGGAIGLPGAGGMGAGGLNGIKSGCAGGVGGPGGNGGDGGGGRGGHSVALASVEGTAVNGQVVEIALGLPGLGGNGGNPSFFEERGKDGHAEVSVTFEK
jgi:hypothetical protein